MNSQRMKDFYPYEPRQDRLSGAGRKRALRKWLYENRFTKPSLWQLIKKGLRESAVTFMEQDGKVARGRSGYMRQRESARRAAREA